MRTALLILSFVVQAASAENFARDYYNGVFQADLSWVAEAETGNDEDALLKRQFERVILNGEPGSTLDGVKDPLVIAIVRRYEAYWRSAFLQPGGLEALELELMEDVRAILDEYGVHPVSSDSLDDIGSWLANNGYGHRGGRTSPLLDFMLWKNTRTVDYDVELTDRVQPVTVHFLQDFLVRGWSHFGTFGRSSTGGWADKDALYCIEEAYDLNSENFRNNYLRHEARHFADYELFPKLGAPDLEYRAKLTELSFGTRQTERLKHFTQHAALSAGAAHAIANWNVSEDVREALTRWSEQPKNESALVIQNEEIARIARVLLAKNTDELNEAGGEHVVSVIRLPE